MTTSHTDQDAHHATAAVELYSAAKLHCDMICCYLHCVWFPFLHCNPLIFLFNFKCHDFGFERSRSRVKKSTGKG